MAWFGKKKDNWYTIINISFQHGTRVRITDGQYEGRTGLIAGKSVICFLVDLGGMKVEIYYCDLELVGESVKE